MSFVLKQIPRAFSRVCLRNGTIVSPFKTGVRKKSGAVLTEENIKKYLKVVFSQADKDGQVSTENIKEVFKMFLTSPGKSENPWLYKLFDEFVFNDKPTLSLEELEKRVNSITAYMVYNTVVEYVIKEKFSRVDENKDGKLNKEEASKLLEELHPFSGKEKVDQLMTKLDKDKDGLISYEVFLEYVKNYMNEEPVSSNQTNSSC